MLTNIEKSEQIEVVLKSGKKETEKTNDSFTFKGLFSDGKNGATCLAKTRKVEKSNAMN